MKPNFNRRNIRSVRVSADKATKLINLEQKAVEQDDAVKDIISIAKLEAEDLLQQAEMKKNKMLDDTRKDIIEMKMKAEDDLLVMTQDSHSRIKKQVYENQSEEFLKSSINMIGKINNDFEALRPWLSEFIIKCVHTAVASSDKSDVLINMIEKQIDTIKDRWKMVISVHPSDHDKVKRYFNTVSSPLQDKVSNVIADPSLELGECQISSSDGIKKTSVDFNTDQIIKYIQKFSYD